MHTFILLFALQCFFPIAASSTAEFLGLSVANRESQTQDFNITVTSSDGAGEQSGRLSVPPGGQRAVLLNELVRTLPSSGWIAVDSLVSGCPVYFTSGNSEVLEGAEGAASLSTSIILPHVEVNTGFVELAHTDTVMTIVNPNSSPAAVTAELFGLDGAARGTSSLSIPSRGSVTVQVSRFFMDRLPNKTVGGKVFRGYIRLSADRGVAAWQRLETPQSRALLRGRGAEELRSAGLAVIPHFVFGGSAAYGSVLNLLNPTTAAIDLELSARSDTGSSIGETVQLRLAPGEVRRASVPELFRVVTPAIFPPLLISGYIRIRERQGGAFQIAGDIEIFTDARGGHQSAILSAISDPAAASWLLPFAVSSGSYFTGYVIVNPNELLAVQTDVTVEILDANGVVLSRTSTSMSPRTRVAATIPAGISNGYVRVVSNLPVHVFGTVGVRDNRTMDQITAVPQ